MNLSDLKDPQHIQKVSWNPTKTLCLQMNFLSRNPTLGHLQVSRLTYWPWDSGAIRWDQPNRNPPWEIKKSASQRKDNYCTLGPFLIVESHCLHVFNSIMLFVYLLFVNPPIKIPYDLDCRDGKGIQIQFISYSMSNKFISYPETYGNIPISNIVYYRFHIHNNLNHHAWLWTHQSVLLNLSLQFHRLPWQITPSTKLVAMLPSSPGSINESPKVPSNAIHPEIVSHVG